MITLKLLTHKVDIKEELKLLSGYK